MSKFVYLDNAATTKTKPDSLGLILKQKGN